MNAVPVIIMVETEFLANYTVFVSLAHKTGNASSKANYRPIALTSVLSKVFETALLSKLESVFETSDYQFGFKGALYRIQILCRRYTFWPYPAGLTIADPPG